MGYVLWIIVCVFALCIWIINKVMLHLQDKALDRLVEARKKQGSKCMRPCDPCTCEEGAKACDEFDICMGRKGEQPTAPLRTKAKKL